MAHQNAIGRLDVTQNIPLTTAPATSAAIGPQSYKIRLVATVACNVSIGDAASVLLPAMASEYFQCSPGQTVTATAVTGTGSLCMTEII
jgi:hypothetical protein